MRDSVVDRFLDNEIEVRRGKVVRDGNRLGAVKRARRLPFPLDAVSQVGKRGHESLGINRNGKQPPQDGPKLLLAALQSLDHPLD